MFEAFKRIGVFLKFGLQGIFIVLGAYLICCGAIKPLGAITVLIVVIEVLARIIVWIISGYFETNPKANISQTDLRKMREYYTYHHLRNRF
jgi:hypothetical protein